MNEQTEKLQGEIIDIVFTNRTTDVANEIATQILQVCKEAGLKFVPEIDYLTNYQAELRTVGNDLSSKAKTRLKLLNSQIKEIEVK